MTEVMMRFPGTVTDARGTFLPCVMARDRGDGSWGAWLEFVPADPDASTGYATPIETRQHGRVAVERWASGLTRVYAEGALARARAQRQLPPTSDLMIVLREIVEVLDRRIPDIERAGESVVMREAKRLRACAVQRVAALHRPAR